MPAANRFLKYGLSWAWSQNPLDLEFHMVRDGGQWKMKNGEMAGLGTFYHFKQALHILWPEIVFHDWADRQIRCYLDYRIIGQLGPASTGKTFVPSACVLLDYYMYPHCTTVLVSSTTRESLEMRVLGEVKKLHRLARERYSWIPGNLIEGKQRIVTDDRSIAAEGRDFRNGLVGIAVKRGQNYQGIEEYVGIKNKRIRCLFDEAQFLPRVFVDSIANLNKNPDLKAVVSGNPKDVTDALGIVCEPAAHLGGWDGGIDQTGGTKEWETRYNRGVCLQLVGTDSPNLDGKLGIPLITQEQIDTDIRFYGEDSLQFSMMDLGRMPRGQSNRRVITRQMCHKFHAMEEPIWKDDNRTRVGFLDPAYSGMGGDRSVFGEVQFGAESTPSDSQPSISAIVTQKITDRTNPQILAIIDTMVVPVTGKDELPEDQIALFVKSECERRGIAPENFFFDSTGRGSLMGAFARLWSPQVQGIEFGGKPSDRKVSADMDVEASRYYSNLVTELWMNSRYLIEAGQCRGMTEELMMEGCMREWGYVGLGAGSRIKIEKKDDMKKRAGRSPDIYDAFCFSGSTLIHTPHGQVPINQIKEGDIVNTPMGPTIVDMVHCHPVTEITSVAFSNDVELCGTGAHKIFTKNQGWRRLDALVVVDETESIYNLPVWLFLNTLFTKVKSTGFKALVDTIHATEGKVRRRDFYIELSGLSTTGVLRKVIAFIIKTVIGKITGSQIWNWLKRANTNQCTWQNDPSLFAGLLMRLRPSEDCMLASGTVHQKALNGTDNMEKQYGWREKANQLGASCVGEHLGLTSVLDSAPSNVETNPQGNAWSLLGIVWSAARALFVTSMSRPRIVPGRVQTKQCGQPENVYNLTLREHNAYYANGILVANCCGLEGARRRGFIIKRQVAVAHKRVDNTWKKQLRERAANLAKVGVLNHAV